MDRGFVGKRRNVRRKVDRKFVPGSTSQALDDKPVVRGSVGVARGSLDTGSVAHENRHRRRHRDTRKCKQTFRDRGRHIPNQVWPILDRTEGDVDRSWPGRRRSAPLLR